MTATEDVVFSHQGYCQLCDSATTFAARWPWFRDHLICTRCESVPRERALYATVEMFYPGWRNMDIHEWSPTGRGVSLKFLAEGHHYIASHWDATRPPGEQPTGGDLRNESIELQTFENEIFDLVITQDAFEHLFDPEKAMREIARTLRPGGAHICTVPLVNKHKPTVRRASIRDGAVVHLLEPQYHGVAGARDDALVTFDWGYDIAGYLGAAGGLEVELVFIDNIDLGIQAEFNDVLICRKPRNDRAPL